MQNKLTITFNKMITSGKSDWSYPFAYDQNEQDRKCFSMQLILVVDKVDMINQIC